MPVEPHATDTPDKWSSTILQTLCLVLNAFIYVCTTDIREPLYTVKRAEFRSQYYLVCTKFTQYTARARLSTTTD